MNIDDVTPSYHENTRRQVYRGDLMLLRHRTRSHSLVQQHSFAASAIVQPNQKQDGEASFDEAPQITRSDGNSRTSSSAATAKTKSQSAQNFKDKEDEEAVEKLETVMERARRRREDGRNIAKVVSRAVSVVTTFLVKTPGWLADNAAYFASLDAAQWSEKLKKLRKDIGHFVYHYWVGSKLLAADISISTRLVTKVLRGKQLTRRERLQLTRTTADIIRIVPMLFFVLVPFMEFLLPVALKLFPNILPSTYEHKEERDAALRRRLLAKMEMAAFLQDSVLEMSKDIKRTGYSSEDSENELVDFITRVRSGEKVSNGDIVRLAPLFNDELTLDNLRRSHLEQLCEFVGISNLGTDGFLRYKLRTHLRKLREDDYDIRREGVDSLTDSEMRAACNARGMRAPHGSGSREFMSKQLEEWIELSLGHSLPSSLLLLSRALTLASASSSIVASEKLEDRLVKTSEVLSYLPNDSRKLARSALAARASTAEEEIETESIVTAAAPAEQGEMEVATEVPEMGSHAEIAKHYEQRLEYLQEQDKLAREEAKEEEERRQREEEEEAASLAAEAPMEDTATTVVAEGVPDISTPHMTAEMQEDEAELQAAAESQDAESSEEEMNETERLAQAMLTLASQSCVTGERSRLIGLVQNELDLMREIETSDATAETSYMSFGGGKGLQCTRGTSKRRADPGYSSEIKNAASAAGRVANMLRDVDKELAALDQKVGDSMRIFDSDNDGVISVNEIGSAPEEVFLRHIRKDGMNNGKKYKEKVLRLFQSIDTDGDGKITLEEIKSALKTMEKYK